MTNLPRNQNVPVLNEYRVDHDRMHAPCLAGHRLGDDVPFDQLGRRVEGLFVSNLPKGDVQLAFSSLPSFASTASTPFKP